jgi:hypothetical protein
MIRFMAVPGDAGVPPVLFDFRAFLSYNTKVCAILCKRIPIEVLGR